MCMAPPPDYYRVDRRRSTSHGRGQKAKADQRGRHVLDVQQPGIEDVLIEQQPRN